SCCFSLAWATGALPAPAARLLPHWSLPCWAWPWSSQPSPWAAERHAGGTCQPVLFEPIDIMDDAVNHALEGSQRDLFFAVFQLLAIALAHHLEHRLTGGRIKQLRLDKQFRRAVAGTAGARRSGHHQCDRNHLVGLEPLGLGIHASD